jgi:hypothetical protein
MYKKWGLFWKYTAVSSECIPDWKVHGHGSTVLFTGLKGSLNMGLSLWEIIWTSKMCLITSSQLQSLVWRCGNVDPCHAYKLAHCDGPNELHDKSVDQGVCRVVFWWNLVEDRLLAWLSRGNTHTQGYSDNIALLITGKIPSTTLSETMQRVLNIVQS